MAVNQNNRGSALFIILIAVMLFAALSFAVAQMFRGGNPNAISEEKAKLYADEILNYGRSLRQASMNLKISNGCGDMDISFENASVAGYEHTPAAADKCKVFASAGGGMNYLKPSTDWLDMLYSPAALRGDWFFPAKVCVPGTGDAAAGCSGDSVDNEALLVILPYVNQTVCIAINNSLGVANPGGAPPQETGNAWPVTADKFAGSQGDGESLDQGAMAGCFQGDGVPPAGSYHFFQVLVAR